MKQQIQQQGKQVPMPRSQSTLCATHKVQTRYTIDLQSSDSDYLLGHKVGDTPFYPASAFIYLVWKSLAKMHAVSVDQFPVQFSNVKYLQHISLGSVQQITFQVEINQLTGLFEVSESGKSIVTGVVEPLSKLVQMKETCASKSQSTRETVGHREIYNSLAQRGYNFSADFQPVVKTTVDSGCGEVAWTGKWISFLDGMIQMNILAQQQSQTGCVVPTLIKSLRIEPRLMTIDENNNTDKGNLVI